MTFAPGDRVHIPGIGTGTVRETRNPNRYVVEIKGRSMIVGAGALTRAGQERRHRERKATGTSASPPLADTPAAVVPPALDLHGRTVPEAIEALDSFLNDVLLGGHAAVHVIHGRGGGRVKAAVHARLAGLPSVRSFRLDPRNPGVTIVRL